MDKSVTLQASEQTGEWMNECVKQQVNEQRSEIEQVSKGMKVLE